MALEKNELQALTNEFFLGERRDIWFRSNVLLYVLQKKIRLVDGGEFLKAVVEYAESQGGALGNTTIMNTQKTEVFNRARFPWGGYWSGNTYDMLDKVENNGEAADVMIVEGKLGNIQKTIRKKMGAGVYMARSASEDEAGFCGLADLFNTNTAIPYGAIAEADMPSWKANVITDAESIVYPVMQRIREKAAVDENEEGEPDLYITTRKLRDGFVNSIHTQARYQDKDLVNAGFRNILFDGAAVVADSHQAEGYCDGLNTKHLDLIAHTLFNFTKPVWEHDMRTPHTHFASVSWVGQVICYHRAAHCRHTNLTAAPYN